MPLSFLSNFVSRSSILLLLASATVTAQETLVASWSGPEVIINETTGVFFPFSLSSTNHSITDLFVSLNISGGWNGDLYAYLSHSNGFAVLLNRVGRTSTDAFGYDTPGLAVTLVGRAAADIHNYERLSPTYNANGQLTGTWGSDGRNIDPALVLDTTPRNNTLDGFKSQDPNGEWTLYFFDASGGAVSTLKSWTVAVSARNGIGTSTNVGDLAWAPGGSYVWKINDATGTAGTDPGWDLLHLAGNLTVTATNQPDDRQKFTLNLVTLSGSAAGAAAHFNNTVTNTWVIATTSGSVIQFNADKFILNPNGFQNDLGGGSFSVVLLDKSVALVFTPPPPPCADITTPSSALVPTPGTTNMQMTFSNASGLSSVQALTMDNCAISGTAYDSGDHALMPNPISNLTLTARTTLPAHTVKVVLTAIKLTNGVPAAANVLALDTCGRGKSFDPVITTLVVTAGGRVEQRFAGLLSAEHYLQVINATPGLQWLEVNLNGHIFRLNPLAAGQSVAADLALAMNEGDANVVVLTGYGDLGASALVLITDQSAGDLVQLPEVVELALARSGNRVVISWPEALAGWRLQASGTLDLGWQDVAATPVIANGYQTVSLAQGTHPQFFRLRKAFTAATSAPAATARAQARGRILSTTDTLQPMKRIYDRLAW